MTSDDDEYQFSCAKMVYNSPTPWLKNIFSFDNLDNKIPCVFELEEVRNATGDPVERGIEQGQHPPFGGQREPSVSHHVAGPSLMQCKQNPPARVEHEEVKPCHRRPKITSRNAQVKEAKRSLLFEKGQTSSKKQRS